MQDQWYRVVLVRRICLWAPGGCYLFLIWSACMVPCIPRWTATFMIGGEHRNLHLLMPCRFLYNSITDSHCTWIAVLWLLVLLHHHLVYAWLRQELCRVTARLSGIPQGFNWKHLGRTKPDCSNRLECYSQVVIPLGLQEGWHKGHTKGWLPCIEREGWWFKKTKLESLGLRTRVYIQVTRALKLLPKVHKP